jgi:hypothetical protein
VDGDGADITTWTSLPLTLLGCYTDAEILALPGAPDALGYWWNA